jgi:hypothetical protein
MTFSPDPIVERALAVTRSLRALASQLLERAYARLDAGELSLNDFLLMEQRHQAIVNQANAAIYDATERLQPIAQEFAQVEAATKELERLQGVVKTVTDVLNISAQLLLAVSALALMFFDPNPGTVAATASAIFDVSRTIADTAAH